MINFILRVSHHTHTGAGWLLKHPTENLPAEALCRHPGPPTRQRAVGRVPPSWQARAAPASRVGHERLCTQCPPLSRTEAPPPKTSPLTCKRLLLCQNTPDHDGEAARKRARSVSVSQTRTQPGAPHTATWLETAVFKPQWGRHEDAARDFLKRGESSHCGICHRR